MTPRRVLSLLAALAGVCLPAVLGAQSQQVRTVEDRNHVTVMEFGGIYDHQPEANRVYEQEVRQAVSREFLRTHTDDYDFLVTFTRFDYALGDDSEGAKVGGRYYSIKNDVAGIGIAPVDLSAQFGSSGRLQGYIDMGVLSNLASDPTSPAFEQTLSILAHEFQHRWGARPRFRDADGSLSSALLGREGSHWNFLLNTHNSVHYGQEWRDNGDGTFTSVGRATSFYSPLDLYLMGMLDKSQVPPFFLIENAAIDAGRLPEVGVTVTGTKKTITIDDIVAAEGERVPSAAGAPKRFKMGFIFLVRPGEQAEGMELAAINTIRENFSTRALILTGGKGVVQVYPGQPAGALEPPSPLPPAPSGPRTGPIDLAQALDWLLSRQAVDGSWADSPPTRVRDSAAVISLLGEVPSTLAPHLKGLAWLSLLQEHLNVDMVSRRILALHGQFSPLDVEFLAEARNASGGWGLRKGYQSDALDTALALSAIRDTGNLAGDLAYLVAAQNGDGGWGLRPGSASSVQTTIAVLRLGVKFAHKPELTAAVGRGLAWLETRQNGDGGFGDGASTVYETAQAVLHLLDTPFPKEQVALALEYLKAQQLADGSWNGSTYQTALAIRALRIAELTNASVAAAGVTLSNASPIEGQLVTVGVSVTNAGVKDVLDLVVSLFDGDPAAGGIQIGGDVTIANLPALNQVPISIVWDTTGKAGDHRLFVVLDRFNRIDEFDEVDNIASLPITVRPPPVEPDLTVGQTDIAFIPALLQVLPQDQTVTATIANAGQTEAANVAVWLFEGDPSLAVKVSEAVVTVPGRGTALASFQFRVETTGERRYYVVIDPLAQVAEADEGNNQSFNTLLVQGTHDFLVKPGSLRISENPSAPGRDLTIAAVVTNQGTTDAFGVSVRVFIDDPAGPIDVGTRVIDLPAGASAGLSVIWRTSRGLNQVPLVVDVDPANAFPESAENNNRASLPLTVISSNDPNLHVTPAGLQVSSPINEGGDTVITLAVSNNGATDATNVSVAVFLGIPGSGGTQIGPIKIVPVIAAGGQVVVTLPWQGISEHGDKLIYAVVDRANEIAEFDEGDNTAFITVKVLTRTDFVVSPAAISFAPAFPKQGETVVVSAVVINAGEQLAPVRVRFFDGDPAHGGLPIGAEQMIAAVPGLGHATVQVAIESGSAATRAIYVLVDPANEVAESNETNNMAFRTLGVQDASLWFSNLYFSPNGDESQDDTELFFRFEQPQAVGQFTVFDKRRKVVRTIDRADETLTDGSQLWNGLDDAGRVVPDGPYDMAVRSPAGIDLATARVVVDTNNLPVAEALGTKFLLNNNLTCAGDGATAGWLPDDSGLVKWRQTTSIIPNDVLQDGLTVAGVYVISPDGETTTRITPDSWAIHPQAGDGTFLISVKISPDGSKILMARQRYRPGVYEPQFFGPVEYWVVNTDGSGLRKIAETPPGAYIDGPYFYQLQQWWSPSSDRIAFSTKIGSFQGISENRIYVAEADGSGQTLAQSFSGNPFVTLDDVALSPDGARLLFTVLEWTAQSGYVKRVYMSLADGSGKTLVGNSVDGFGGLANLMWFGVDRFAFATSARPTADGSFESVNNSGKQIYLLTLADRTTRLLTSGTGNVRDLTRSPDLRHIAYSESTPDGGDFGGPMRIMVVEEGTEPRQLYAAGPAIFPSHGPKNLRWTADSHRVTWGEAIATGTHICTTEDGEGGVGEATCTDTVEAIGTASVEDGSSRVIPLTAERQHFTFLGPFADGQSYLYVDNLGRLSAVSLVDGASSVIVEDSFANFGSATTFSPSGKYLLYTSRRDSADSSRVCWNGNEFAYDDFALSSVLNLTTQFGFARDRSQLTIRGTAEDANFASYRLEYAPVSSPATWSPLGAASEASAIDAVLDSWIPPSDGAFYVRLTAADKAGNVLSKRRRITWGLTPSITNVAIAPRLFSPNGDGTRDTVTVDYLVLGPVNLAFEFYDSANTLVRRIAQSHEQMGAASVAWDGRNETGQFVADGGYRIHVLDYDFFVTVDTTSPDVGIALGSGLHIFQRGPSCGLGCTQTPGAFVQTPTWALSGHALDPAMATWALEVGTGLNPSEWQFVAEGAENRVEQNLLAVLKTLDGVVGRKYRLSAVDKAGNRSVAVTDFAPTELILHAFDRAPVPAASQVVQQRLGLHTLSVAYTGRTPLQWMTVQYRLQGTGSWSDGSVVPSPGASPDLPWDNSTLAGGKLYDVRVVSIDANGAQLVSNAIVIRADVFLFPEYVEEELRWARGVISLSETITSVTLVSRDNDVDIGLYSNWNSIAVDFRISVASDPTIRPCVDPDRPVEARFKAVGASGKIYYSNSNIVSIGSAGGATCGDGDGNAPGKIKLEIEAAMAAACGLPSPGRVRVKVASNVHLSIQSSLNGPLQAVQGIEVYVDTSVLPEGRYRVFATAADAAAAGSFVVDRTPPAAQITYPGTNQLFCPIQVGKRVIVPVEGIAEDPNFRRYDLEYGRGDNPLNWVAIPTAPAGGVARRGVLGDWDVTDLPSGTYSQRLRVYDEGGNLSCSTVSFFLAGAPTITKTTADLRLISPNGDGVKDSTVVSFELSDAAALSARVYAFTNGQRAVTPTRSIFVNAQLLAGANSFVWDGLADGGARAEDGRYDVVLSAKDACLSTAEGVISITIDSTPPEAVIAFPAGLAATLLVDVRGTATDAHFESYRLEAGATDAPVSWSLVATGPAPVQDALLGKWTTTGAGAVFTLRLTARDGAGNVREALVPVTTSDSSGLITALTVEPALFSPNGDGKLDRSAVEYHVGAAATIRLEVVDGANVVRKVISESAALASAAYTFGWDGKDEAGMVVPDGSYFVRLTATAKNDPARTQIEKTAIVVDTTAPGVAAALPTDASFLKGDILVTGTAADTHLDRYAVAYAVADGGAPATIDEGRQSRSGYVFGTLSGLPDGLYALTLNASDLAQNSAETRLSFTVDNTPPQVALTSPLDGALAGGTAPSVDLQGTILDAHLAGWTLRAGAGAEPVSWTALASGSSAPSPASLLAVWSVQALADGPYTVSLVATDKAGVASETRIGVIVDNTPPLARIALPADQARLGGPAEILGDAFDVNFKSALLALSPGDAATANQFELLAEVTAAVSNGPLFSWQALPPDGTYTLRLTVEDLLGQRSQALTTVKIDTEPPAPPTALTAVVEQRKNARLNWTTSGDPDLAGYHVYRGGTKITATPIVPVTYLDQDLADGNYRYQVKAVDTSGLESTPSNEATVAIDLTPPSTRIQFPSDGSVISGLIDVRGTAAASDDFKEYRLLVGVGAAPVDFTLIRRSPAPVTSGLLGEYDTLTKAEGTVLTFRLEADDLVGNTGTAQVTVTVDNLAPAAPVLVSATLAGTDITVSWQANAEPDLAGYLLYNNDVLANVRRIVNGSTTPYILTATSFPDKALPDGDHKYYAFAVDKAGNISDTSRTLIVTIETRPPRATITEPANGSETEHSVTLVATTPDQDVERVQFQFKAAAAGVWIDLGAAAPLAPYQATWDPAALAYGDYHFRAVATDTHGNTDPAPSFITITLRDLTPPEAPASLAARVNGAAATLSWPAVAADDLDGYAVFRRPATTDGSAAVRITATPIDETTFTDTGLDDDTYVYTVTAVDASGNESEPSPPASAHIYAPTMQTPAVCVAGDLITVSGAGAEPNSTVRLFADTGTGPLLVVSGQSSADGTFAFDAIAIVAGANVFTADVTDASGNISKLSQPLSITRSAVPEPPAGFSAAVDGDEVTLTWDENAAIAGYTLTRNGTPLNSLDDVTSSGSASASSKASSENQADHAVDDDSDSYWLPRSSDTAPWWALNFPAPVLISRIDLEWAQDGDDPPTHFDVQSWDGQAWVTLAEIRGNTALENSITPSGPVFASKIRIFKPVSADFQAQLAEVHVFSRLAIAGTTFTDPGLGNGKYTYLLSALNACVVEGPPASAVANVGDVTPPAPPIALAAVVAGSSVALSWTAGQEADLAGYNVYRKAGDTLWTKRNVALVLSTTLVDADIANGNYFYRVTAQDALGNESDPSNEAPALVDVPPPGQVAQLGVTAPAAGGALDLTWTAAPGAVSGYAIFRSLVAGGPYEAIAGEPVAVLVHRDRGVINGTRYYYVVRVADAAGNHGAPSNEADGVPLDTVPPEPPLLLYPTDAAHPLVIATATTAIRGLAEPRATVTLLNEGFSLGQATASATPTSDEIPIERANTSMAFVRAESLLVTFTQPPGTPASALTFIDTVTGETRRVDSVIDGTDPIVTPDGRTVAYVFQQTTFKLFDRATNQVTRQFLVPQLVSAPTFSPDGSSIAYISGSFPDHEIWILNLTTGVATPRVANADADYLIQSVWAPAGDLIVYTNYNFITNVIELRSVGVVSGAATVIDGHAGFHAPSFSPDGNQLLFTSMRGGQEGLWIHDLATGDTRPFADGGPARRSASFSPDGSAVAYIEVGNQADDLHVRDLATGEDTLMLADSPGGPALWTLDRGLILPEYDRLVRVHPAGAFEFAAVHLPLETNVFSAVAEDAAGNMSRPADPITLLHNRASLPDLVTEDASLVVYPRFPLSGESVRLSATVRNDSDLAAHQVDVAFYYHDAEGLEVAIGQPRRIALGAHQQTVTSIDWQPGSLVGAQTVIVRVDPANTIVEVLETNNSAQTAVLITVDGAASVAVSVDRATYVPSATVVVDAEVTNPGAPADFVLEVRIEDEAGFLVTSLLTQPLDAFGRTSRSVRATWPAGGVFAGNYRARAVLRRAQGAELSASANFAVLGDVNVESGITTDRAVYQAGDLVQVAATVRNTSTNLDLDSVAVTTRVLDQNGGEVFRATTDIAVLMAGAQSQMPLQWVASAPGAYTARVDVSAGGQTITSATTSLSVSGVSRLQGRVSATPAPVPIRTEFILDAEATNTGTLGLDGATLRLVVFDVEHQAEVRASERSVELPPGAIVPWQVSLSSTGLALQTYKVLLQLDHGGTRRTLASASVSIVDRQAPLVVIASPANGEFFRTDLAIAAGATDDASGVAQVEFQVDGGAWSALAPTDVATGRFTASFPATAATEGAHSLSVRATDRAGNSDSTTSDDANPVSRQFVIDVTPPAVDIAGVEDGGAYSAAVYPVITVTDTNLANANTHLNGAPFVSGKKVSAAAAYVLTVTASDRAGNVTSRMLAFTIGGNQPPEAQNQLVTTPEDTPVVITLYASDPDSHPAALVFDVSAAPSHGTLSGTLPSLTYVPAKDFNGSDSFTFTVSDGNTTSAPATVSLDVTPVNDRPIANAGAAQSVLEGASVGLDGSGSVDLDADTIGYRWTQIGWGDVPAVLDRTDPARPTFVAPEVTRNGSTLVFELIVTDGTADSVPAMVSVVVGNVNRAPEATEESLTVEEDTPVSWTVAAVDPDEDPLTLEIQQPTYGAVKGTGLDLTYTPPLHFHGIVQFDIVVRDPARLSATAHVQVTVAPVNDRPVASAGADRTVDESDLVTLDGSASGDVDGDALRYEWTQSAGPGVALQGPDTVRPSFVAPAVPVGGATLTFSLKVADAQVESLSQVNITVRNTNHPPVADAGPPQRVGAGALVALDGTSSFDPDSDPLVYTWHQVGVPVVDLVGSDTATPSWVAPIVGTVSVLTFELTVSDGAAATTDSVAVTVDPLNQRPTAQAGDDQTVRTGALVTLDGRDSTDPDRDPLTYRWTQTAGVPVTLAGETASRATFKAPKVGPSGDTLSFDLVVSDVLTDSLPDRVSILVLAQASGPVCSAAVASPQQLWPPNHQMVTVVITGLGGGHRDDDRDDDDHGRKDDEHGRKDDDHGRKDDEHGRKDDDDRRNGDDHDDDDHDEDDEDDEDEDDDDEDDDDDPRVTVRILSVTQDEPVNGTGDGDTGPDAIIQGDAVLLRAERAGNGNGRVYQIWFTATDDHGATCTGSVRVSVPRNSKGIAIDDGQLYDATKKQLKKSGK